MWPVGFWSQSPHCWVPLGTTVSRYATQEQLNKPSNVRVVLCNKRGRCRGFVFPVGGEVLHTPVVSRKSVNSRLDKNKAELHCHVLAMLLQMFAEGYGALDQHVKILGNLRRQSVMFQDTQNFSPCHSSNGTNTIGITKLTTNRRWRKAFLGKLADLLHNFLGRRFQPSRRRSSIRTATA